MAHKHKKHRKPSKKSHAKKKSRRDVILLHYLTQFSDDDLGKLSKFPFDAGKSPVVRQSKSKTDKDKAYDAQLKKDQAYMLSVANNLSEHCPIIARDARTRTARVLAILDIYDEIINDSIETLTLIAKIGVPDKNIPLVNQRVTAAMMNYLGHVLKPLTSSKDEKIKEIGAFLLSLIEMYSEMKIKKEPLDKRITPKIDALLDIVSKKSTKPPFRFVVDTNYWYKRGEVLVFTLTKGVENKYVNQHKRSTHINDIRMLMSTMKAVYLSYQSYDDQTKAFKQMVSLLERALGKEYHQYTRPILGFIGGRTHQEFIDKVNHSTKRYYYPRLLANMLREIYQTPAYALAVQGQKPTPVNTLVKQILSEPVAKHGADTKKHISSKSP